MLFSVKRDLYSEQWHNTINKSYKAYKGNACDNLMTIKWSLYLFGYLHLLGDCSVVLHCVLFCHLLLLWLIVNIPAGQNDLKKKNGSWEEEHFLYMMQEGFKLIFTGRRTSIYPTPNILMPVPTRDAQNLENVHNPAGLDKEEVLHYEGGQALEQIVQRSWECTIPGSFQGQGGRGSEKSRLVRTVPAHGREWK